MEVDGAVVIPTFTDTATLVPGTVGVRSWNLDMEWDNFSVHRTSDAQ